MDQGPLVTEQIKAGEKLIAAFSAYKPVTAAFWAKESDGGNWYLYLASEQINDSTTNTDYGEVLRLVGRQTWLDPFQVKVIGADHPVARAVLELVCKSHNLIPMRYFGPRFGDLSVDEAYIYSVPTMAVA
jgi:hypothetical protein